MPAIGLIYKWIQLYARLGSHRDKFFATPAVLVNSFPKSGTHLLDQIVTALPSRCNYGAFLSSMTSSVQFRRRTEQSSCRFIRASVPGEIVRAHLVYSDPVAAALHEQRFVHYFIYRDPRDVVLSEAHYCRSINRWHRLSRYFREASSLEEGITISIAGLQGDYPHLDHPDIAERYARYVRWIEHPDVYAVKFEELVSAKREQHLLQMAQHYQRHSDVRLDLDLILQRMRQNIAPEQSHTYRKGRSGDR